MMKLTQECQPPDPSISLQRLWTVMTDPHCSRQEERQIILMDTFLSVAENRVKLRDVQMMAGVISVVANKADRESKYQQYLQKLLDLFKTPIRMEKASDQLEYKDNVIDLFTSLGIILLHSENKKVKHQIFDIVLGILMTKRVGDSDMIPINPCVKALELSEFSECLADFMAISESDLYSMAIFVALQICLTSKLCCWTFLMKEVVESILVRLTIVHTEDVADIMYRLLWALFNCTDRREDWERTPKLSRTALRSLRYVLREQALVHSHPGRDKDAFFNAAALVLKIMHLYPDADYVLSGLTEDITVSATLSESVLEIHIIPYYKTKAEHLHFKRIMLACIAASPINSLSVEIFERYKLPECLVSMLRLETLRGTPTRSSKSTNSSLSLGSLRKSSTAGSEASWLTFDEEQSMDLFTSAIPVVCELFDCLCKRFINADLINTLTSFLDKHYLEGNHDIDDVFHAVIKTIFLVCFNEKHPLLVRKALLQAPTVHMLLRLCSIILNSASLTIRTQSILSHMLIILSALLEKQKDLQIYHADISFHVIKLLYHRIIKPLPNDSIIDNKLIVAVSNFAWVVFTQEENLPTFIDSGELYSHLDILEKGTLPTQLVYLSMLVDVAENYKSVPYLVSWRGKKGVTLLKLLCKIWRDEENRLKVPRCKSGCITDIERPLMGEDQYKISNQDKGNYISACDVFGSCRPKIYALVQLLHRHDEVTRLCEEHYRLGYDVLTWEEQVTMQVIEAYLPLKLGEVWWEIFNKQEDVLSLDRYLAQTLADRYLNWSLSVKKAQHALINQLEASLNSEEQRYYSEMRSVRLTNALEALREVIAIARSADRQILLSAQEQLREGIETSRPVTAEDLDLHIAFPSDVRILLFTPEADISLQNLPE